MAGFTNPSDKYVQPQRNPSLEFDFTEVDSLLAREYTQGSVITPVRVITTAGNSAQQVKITDGTDIAQVTSSGDLRTENEKALSFAINGTVAQNNTQTVLTAGASGAKVYSVTVSYFVQTGANNELTVTIAGATFHKCINRSVASNYTQNFHIELSGNYIQLTNGQTVTITSGGTELLAYCSVRYI